MGPSSIEACFRGAIEDFLGAAEMSGTGGDVTPMQAATYVAVACRTGEIGLQTLLGGFLRIRLHERETALKDQSRLAVNRTGAFAAMRKQPDFQILGGPNFEPSMLVECKLMDAECRFNSAPEQIMEGLERDLLSLAGIRGKAAAMGCLFIVTSFGKSSGRLPNDIRLALEQLGAESIGNQVQLWLPEGVEEGPYGLEVMLVPVGQAIPGSLISG